jgi:membrane associated rhomboid family serine protease
MFSLPQDQLTAFLNKYSLIPYYVIRGINLETLITSMFLHGGIGHILSNMLFLHIFGDNLEDWYGHIRYLLLYLFFGVIGAITHIVINPESLIPTLGASGAIAGLLGGYLVLYPLNKIDVLVPFFFIFKISIPAFFMLIYWIIFQFLQGYGSLGVDSVDTAYFAHIGGFIAGFTVTIIMRIGRILNK